VRRATVARAAEGDQEGRQSGLTRDARRFISGLAPGAGPSFMGNNIPRLKPKNAGERIFRWDFVVFC